MNMTNRTDGTNMSELMAELNRVLVLASDKTPYCVLSRRQVEQVVAALETIGDLSTVDPWLATIEDVTTPIEYRIYKTLYEARGGVVAIDAVWKLSRARTVNSLWAHMRRLRDKCALYDWGDIETVHRKGYMLVLPGLEKEA